MSTAAELSGRSQALHEAAASADAAAECPLQAPVPRTGHDGEPVVLTSSSRAGGAPLGWG